jgi:hypothetical protein
MVPDFHLLRYIYMFDEVHPPYDNEITQIDYPADKCRFQGEIRTRKNQDIGNQDTKDIPTIFRIEKLPREILPRLRSIQLLRVRRVPNPVHGMIMRGPPALKLEAIPVVRNREESAKDLIAEKIESYHEPLGHNMGFC